MLGFIPTNRSVRVYTVGATDDFGIAIADTEGKEYDCHFSFNTEYKKVIIADGTEIIFVASILFPNPEDVKIKLHDLIEFTDDSGALQKKAVRLVQYKRDFGGNVSTVKAVI